MVTEIQNPKSQIQNPLTLAIESSVRGGSLSLQRGFDEIASWVGDDSVSRAEELLPNIDALLRSVGIESSDLELVAVSLGPGSFTGIRIGIATALGLRQSLDIECVGVPLLSALAASGNAAAIAAAVPIGRFDVAWQRFKKRDSKIIEVENTNVVNLENFFEEVRTQDISDLIIHEDLMAVAPASKILNLDTIRVVNAGLNLAKFIGIAAQNQMRTTELRPIYLQRPSQV